MAAYSMDLRLRVLRDADAGLPSDELAEKYSVSGCVRQVVQFQIHG